MVTKYAQARRGTMFPVSVVNNDMSIMVYTLATIFSDLEVESRAGNDDHILV